MIHESNSIWEKNVSLLCSFIQIAFSLVFICLFTFFPPSLSAEADTIYVTQNGAGTKNGNSWKNACGETAFITALQNANSGDVFWIARGSYRPSLSEDETVSFRIKSGVALYGGFKTEGGESQLNERDWVNNVTVLTGDLHNDDLDKENGVTPSYYNIQGDNSDTVVTGSGTDTSARLDGLTVTGGDGGTAYSLPFVHYGAGIYNENGNLTIINCTFAGNAAADCGGGMANIKGNPIVDNCIFTGNFANLSGGGMANEEADATVIDCSFTQNVAVLGSGGGMDNYESSPDVKDCTFTSNSATLGYAGGLSNVGGSPTVIDCTFTRNLAHEDGGGMDNSESSPDIRGCTFTKNSAMGFGGGMGNHNCDAAVTNCTFTENAATCGGGGMANNGYSPEVTNVTFTHNSAGLGGGIYNEDSNPVITNCIFWDNSGKEIVNDGGASEVTYCVVTGGYPGNGNTDADPKLEDLHNNGGSTQTCALQASSSAINNGSWDANLWEIISTDQRGISRDMISPDMGAYEYKPDLKILALFLEGTGRITREPEGTVFGTEGNQWTYDNGTNLILTATAEAPWKFLEWSGDITGTNATMPITIHDDTSVTAAFTRQYTVTTSAGIGGTIAPSGNVAVAFEKDQPFYVLPYPGYTVANVQVDGLSLGKLTTYTFTKVTTNHTIEAFFTPGSETTPTPTPAGSATPTPTTGSFPLPDSKIPLPGIALDLVLVGGGEILAGPTDITDTGERTNLLQSQSLRSRILEDNPETAGVGKYNWEVARIFSLETSPDTAGSGITLLLEALFTNLSEGYTPRLYIVGRTYDNRGNPTGFAVLNEKDSVNESMATRLRNQGKTESWKVYIADGSETDGNPEEGFVDPEIAGVLVMIPTSADIASGGGGGCTSGAFPLGLLVLFPLMQFMNAKR